MTKKQKKVLWRIIATAVLVAVVKLFSIGGVAGTVLYLAAYLIIGYDILRKAFRGIIKGQVFDENFLMAVATIGAFALAIYEKSGDYNEAIAVMLFYQIGELFQSYAVGKSRKNISALMDIRPDYANIEQDGQLVQVDPDEVAIGTVIVVQPGEKVPIDGVITEGRSTLNTSALTGESLPRDAQEGDEIISGCVNLTGLLRVTVTKPCEESTVSKILELVENSSEKKAVSEQFITRFAKYYTPCVVYAALALFLIPTLMLAFLPAPPAFLAGTTWDNWLHRALTFLVISCPCALVISIPLGYFGGIGAASKKGILVKGGHVLDALHNIKTVAFDKTGTLTRGVFEVTRVLPAEGASEEDVLNAARLVESRSTHPIARAIMKTAPGSHGFALEAVESKEIPGKGLSAEHKGRTLLVGNALLLQDAGISVPSLPAGQGSVVYVAVGNAYLGAIEVSDVLRPESAPAIESLRRQGIERLVMLTGDRPESAAIVAKELHLDEYRAGLLPEGKAAELESLGPRQSVLFVGDGINDAPVLAMSGVGVAMGGLGSEAAIEVADAVILDDSPSRLPEMFSIAAKTRVVVWQNIVMALGIKGLFMVLGVVGLSGLWEAVFADVGVALLAVLNATRTAR